ncbi:MAG: hypothetical protein IT379_10690 [Deltaproteobacteria bacterium]|nr:hypothetical protein [Deltaproteobacteria bacterium]
MTLASRSAHVASFLVLLASSIVPAIAVAQDQQQQGAPVLVTALRGTDRPVAGTVSPDGSVTEPPPPLEGVVFLRGWMETVDFSGSDFTFDAPDGVAAGLRHSTVHGSRFGSRGTLLGGVTFGASMRPVPWLEVTPMSLTLGGGSIGGPWQSPTGGQPGYELALSSAFLMRLHVEMALRLPLGPLSLFAGGSAGLGVYILGARTSHAQIGDLGDESMSAAAFELAWTAGVSIDLGDVELTGGIRQTGVGADAIGGFVGFGWTFGPPPQTATTP